MQFQAMQIAYSSSPENQSKTFENHTKCVISRTPFFLVKKENSTERIVLIIREFFKKPDDDKPT